MKQLKRTGYPLDLTVNGKAEPVVHNGEASQQLSERTEAINGIRRGLKSFRRGKFVTLEQSEARMRRNYGIPR